MSLLDFEVCNSPLCEGPPESKDHCSPCEFCGRRIKVVFHEVHTKRCQTEDHPLVILGPRGEILINFAVLTRGLAIETD